MPKYRILSAIKKNAQKSNVSFHTPGHKEKRAFAREFREAKRDITELSFSDDLANPQGIIRDAQEDIAKLLPVDSAFSFLVTDGTTCGIYAMIYAMAYLMSKPVKHPAIVIPRNSHKSVYNACRVLKVQPLIVMPEIYDSVAAAPNPEAIYNTVAYYVEGRNEGTSRYDVVGILVTSPDYYGNIADCQTIAQIAKEFSLPFAVDGAHGTHLAFSDEYSEYYAGKYADMWTDGLHKCMPAYTQASLVSVKNEELAKIMQTSLNLFRTSSPSYLIMASAEYGLKYVHSHKRELMDRLYKNKDEGLILKAVNKIRKAGYKVYGYEDVKIIESYENQRWEKVPKKGVRPVTDRFKLCVDVSCLDIDPAELQKKIERRSVYPEFNDGRYMMFYITPFTTRLDLGTLVGVLKWAAKKFKKSNDTHPFQKNRFAQDEPVGENGERLGTAKYLMAVYAADKVEIPIEDALNEISGENLGVIPPGYPIVVAGERISARAIEVLTSPDVDAFGLTADKKVTVVCQKSSKTRE